MDGKTKTTTRILSGEEIDSLLEKEISKAKAFITPANKVCAFAIFVVQKDGKLSGAVHSDVASMPELMGMMDRYVTEATKALEYDS